MCIEREVRQCSFVMVIESVNSKCITFWAGFYKFRKVVWMRRKTTKHVILLQRIVTFSVSERLRRARRVHIRRQGKVHPNTGNTTDCFIKVTTTLIITIIVIVTWLLVIDLAGWRSVTGGGVRYERVFRAINWKRTWYVILLRNGFEADSWTISNTDVGI